MHMSMEQSAPWEVDNCSFREEISGALCYPRAQLWSQESAIGPYSELLQSNPYPDAIFTQDTFLYHFSIYD
jgi:hypothetical protein